MCQLFAFLTLMELFKDKKNDKNGKKSKKIWKNKIDILPLTGRSVINRIEL